MSTFYDTWTGSAVIMIMAMAGLREYVKEHPNPNTGEHPVDGDDVRRWRDAEPQLEIGPQAPQNGGPRMPPLATRQASPTSVIDMDPMQPQHIVPFS